MGKTVEETYKKIDNLEHVLLRPDMYVGSIESSREKMWVYNEERDRLETKEIDFIPALYKIYDEILVNAADNKVRDPSQTLIKVDIDKENNEISIMNNGKGIPIEIHKEHGVYVPELIFGEMMTSSNYDDSEKKVTGGRNGFGAKLCNIFSTKFTVETVNKRKGKKFKQTWTGNMKTKGTAKITEYNREDYTKIIFRPDLSRFGTDSLSDDMVALFRKRAYDIAGTTPGLIVHLDGQKISFDKKKPFEDYCKMYIKDAIMDTGAPLQLLYEKPSNKEAKDRWEIGFAISDIGFQNISFVNSIATTKGGQHVNVVVDQLVKKLEETVNKKNKGGLKVKSHQIKTHCWIFVKSQIENPAFDSQTKENLTLVRSKHGSKPILSDAFIKKVEKSGVVEAISNFMKFKENQAKGKIGGGKKARSVKIRKLEDAPEAGKARSANCTLILTEGDSAKTAAMAGVSSMAGQKQYYGIFPLRGKLLNCREAGHAQLTANEEIKNIVKAMGFDFKRKYMDPEDLKQLRYGKLMIMTDQDVDGSHIKGLIINFLHHFWPSMIRGPIIQQFITPIVKVYLKKNQDKANCEKKSFYSLPEFNKWYREVTNPNAYVIDYYKGLGTSDAAEFKEYFVDLARHRIPFRYGGVECDDRLKLAFAKDRVDDRKVWLTEYMDEAARRMEAEEDELTLYDRERIPYVTYKDFIDKEMVLFSHEDLCRSVPCAIDGFKPGQRKVMWTCFKRNDKQKVKVAQLAGSVSEMSAYHHGEVSLMQTIIKLAQDYVGSNNVNLLQPLGQFGSRVTGGKDHAAARYIFTKLSKLARVIYPETDDNLYRYKTDDNKKVEPEFYTPIVPMVLVNGSHGIGTGWSTHIPNHDIRKVAKNVRRMIAGNEPLELTPCFKDFRGKIVEVSPARCMSFGEIALLDNDTVEITELPPTVWTEDYKEKLMKFMGGPDEKGKDMPKLIEDFENHSSHNRVKFIVKLTPGQMSNARKEGFHSYFNLTKSMTYSNTMVLFDALGKLTVYKNTTDIAKDHFAERKVKYKQRHAFLLSQMEARRSFITNKARFIVENIEKKMTVMNRKKKDVIKTLIERNYDSDPVKAWKAKIARELGIEIEDEDKDDSEEDSKADFDYLLKMPIYNLTFEQKEKLLKEKGEIEAQYAALQQKTPIDLWKEDLDNLDAKLDELDKLEKDTAKADAKKTTGKKGGKSMTVEPSGDGEYIEAHVTKEMEKKIAAAAKPRGAKRVPKPKAEPKPKKEPKADVKQEKGGDSDDSIGKLKKKSGKNPWDTDSEDDADDFGGGDSSDDFDVAPKREPAKKRVRGISSDASANEKPKTKKPMKQATITDAFKAKPKRKSDESSSSAKSSQSTSQSKNSDSDESESDVPARKKVMESSDSSDFEAPPKKTTKKPVVVIEKLPKKSALKKKPVYDSDSDDAPKKKAPAKKASKPKKNVMESESDDDFKAEVDSDEPQSLAARAQSRPGRAKVTKKYAFSDSEDSD